MLAEFLSDIQERWYSTQFGAKERLQFYESASTLLENGVQLKDAVREVHGIYSDSGKQRHHPIALASREAFMGVSNGKVLADAMAAWLPSQERALIDAGQESGDLISALNDCVRLIEARGKILSSVAQATFYPGMLWALLIYLLSVISYKMVPNMARMSDPKTWTGTAAALYDIATFVTDEGVYALGGCIALLILVFATLPYYTGRGRVFLDRLPPWSIYRTLQGTTFLLNVAVMLRAGIKPYDSLQRLSRTANPWLKQRIEATRYGVGLGQNFGQALKNAGHEFPDKQAIQFLSVLASRKGFAEAALRFSDRWLNTSLKQVDAAAGLIRGLSLLLVGAMMILVLLGTYEMEAIVRAGIAQ
ncbi:MAG: type II secretion system F family protein [Pseudomonas sp.]|uniref:type II secretion system F family protein n=1 Tax=Pseudomonas sp. TaxID=306 RepID=UPI00299E049D|nr:type II secretion system F family protein [Pseudomonas sp.]MDX1725961.1 type II secretion system F family protein [Pseudomonas sp.]